MNRIISLAFALLVDITLSSCALGPRDNSDEASSLPSLEPSIINGTLATGADSREAGIVRIGKLGPAWTSEDTGVSNTLFADCGGTLINNRWVLTAAHCLGNQVSNWDAKENIVVVKGPNSPFPENLESIKTNPSYQVATVSRFYFPSGVAETKGDWKQLVKLPEIALLKLQTPLRVNGSEQDFRQKIYAAGESDLIGKVVRAYGYSPMREDSRSDALLRFADFQIHSMVPHMYRYLLQWAPGQRTLYGDSGGPNFLGNELVGVHSDRGDGIRLSRSIAAPYFRDWVMETVNTELESRPSTLMAFSANNVNLAGYVLASFSAPSQALPLDSPAVWVNFNDLFAVQAKLVRVEHDRMIDSQRRDIYEVRADDLKVELSRCPLMSGSTTRRCALKISVATGGSSDSDLRTLKLSNFVFMMRNPGTLGLRTAPSLGR